MSDNFDLIVIGGGPGGVAAAIRGVQLGATGQPSWKARTGAGSASTGPVCPPAFSATVDRVKTIQTAAKMGFFKAEAAVDPAAIFKMKGELVGYFSMGTEGLVKAKGVTPIKGKGRLAGAGRVAVGEKVYQAKAVIVAVGAQWVRPSFPGATWKVWSTRSQFLEEGRSRPAASSSGPAPGHGTGPVLRRLREPGGGRRPRARHSARF